MKKQVPLMIVSLILLGVIIYSVNLNGQLDQSNNDLEAVAGELAQLRESYDVVAEGLASANNKLSIMETTLTETEQKLADSEALVSDLDQVLEGDGPLITRAQALMDSKLELEEQLKEASTELESMEEDRAAQEAAEAAEAEAIQELSLDGYMDDIDEVLADLDKRISELEGVASTLGPLSLERLMITQEAEFMKAVSSDLEAIKEAMKAQ